MSDQSATPPKPKLGSLRDRIAAFEKSASAAPAPGPGPAPRPKPAGFATWKPKVPSPPTSPSASATAITPTEHASSLSSPKIGGMSASDAKESITKAGSLKDRMAALQGKGAFGAPPPLAPKPAAEKPKWKPPPVVHAPVDDDDDDHAAEASAPTSIAAAVERTLSPPTSVKSQEDVEQTKIGEAREESTAPDVHGGAAEDDGEGETAAVDPEEEERQRRAAIAARMARLGGARVGMAPPVFGKKPPVRRPTQEEAPVTQESKPVEDVPRSEPVSSPEPAESIGVVASPLHIASPPVPADVAPIVSPPNESQPAGYFPKSQESLLSRKASESASVLSAESAESQSVKSPSSMPAPAVPRRAGPPRKKPAKPAAPPPEVPEEHVPITEEAEEPAEASLVKLESPPLPPSHEAVKSPESEEPKPDIGDNVSSSPTISTPSPPNREESTSHVEKGVISERRDSDSQYVSTDTSNLVSGDTSGLLSPPPTLTADAQEGVATLSKVDEDELPHGHDLAMSVQPPPFADPSAIKEVDERLLAIAQPIPSTDKDDLAEEEARKKRVAERIAKMGGVNPFAPPPPQRTPSSDAAYSTPAVVSSPTAISRSPPVSTVHDEEQEHASHLVASTSVYDTQTELAAESKDDEEFSDEVEDVDDEDDGSEYYSTVPQESINHNEGSAKEPTRHFDELEPGQFSHVSQAPPIPPFNTRPAVQVQQFTEASNDDEYQEASDEEVLHASADLATDEYSSSLHARPAQPPRRVIPQAPEEDEGADEDETDEEADERLAQSQLFVPPPSSRRAPAAIPPPRRQFSREEEDDDGSENDAPALPHLQRRSVEVPPARSPSPPSDYESQPDSDHDGQALPIPPRNVGGHPPPARNAPPPPPPLESQEDESGPEDRRPPVRRTSSQPTDPTSPSLLTPAFSLSDSEEILDEEEGDPIDPGFHSPSRQTSSANLHAAAQYQAMPSGTPTSPPPPHAPPIAASSSGVEEREMTDQDSEQLRRRTIAERMAKLGGIKFGSAPPVPVSRPPPPLPTPRHENEESAGDVEEEEKPEVLSEEEEERARKERIAAKMAQMGGMRIGMIPMGAGGLPPQRSHVLREDSAPKSPSVISKSPPLPSSTVPTRAVPPPRPPPLPTQLPPQHQAADSGSEYGSAVASEDGVKVEAEESELEDVAYEDAQEPEEPPPPPVPSRASRRMSQRQDSHEQAASPPAPPSRPPVPTSLPNRRSSVQTTRSMTGSSAGETAHNLPPRKSSGFIPGSQSDYVMVEEPESQEAPPPLPPARPTSRAPPSRRTSQMPHTPTLAKQSTDPNDSISSQWELPSIPVSTLDFGTGTDLSLSWTDAGNEQMPTSPPPPPPPAKKASATSELHLSADDLMALWGRVGVQVCEVATSMFEKSKKTLVGDGSYAGFVQAVFAAVPNAAPIPTPAGYYGYLVYVQNGPSVQKRASEIMPGDIVEIQDAKLKGHKGLQTYHQNVGGAGEMLVGVVGEFEAKKAKIRVFHANQHVGQQTVESVSYRLEDLKSGIVKVYRVLEA